jgi:hypothetical protein
MSAGRPAIRDGLARLAVAIRRGVDVLDTAIMANATMQVAVKFYQ